MTNEQLEEIKQILTTGDSSPENDKLQNLYEAYTNLQLELKRQIILGHFNERLAANSGVKESFYFFRGWKEACIKLLNGEVSDNVGENLKRAGANINMQDTIEKLDKSIAEGLSLL